MTSRHEQDFFKALRHWSGIKHRILAYYLEPWSMKVGSRNRVIFVVDPFAGAGQYGVTAAGDPVEGSPMIEVRRAELYEQKFPARRMQVICVEHNQAHFDSLLQTVGESPAKPELIPGTFKEHVDRLATTIGDAPALILLDPIGVKDLDAATCRKLLHKRGPTDAFINLQFTVVHRIGGMLERDGSAKASLPKAAGQAETIDRVFDSEAWRRIAVNDSLDTEGKDKAYLALYYETVLGDRYRYKSAYRVRAEYWGGTKYWLVHASDHVDGLQLMNDAIVKVDKDLFLAAVNAQPDIFPELKMTPLDIHLDDFRQRVRRSILATVSADGIRFDQLRLQLLTGFFGELKCGEYAKAVKALVKEGRLVRKDRQPAKLRDDEVIALPK